MKLKFKVIHRTTDRKWFLIRIALYVRHGSYKLHLFLRDDIDDPHTHPWSYKSLLIIPYKEKVWTASMEVPTWLKAPEVIEYRHSMFTYIERECNIKHKTKLYRFLGIPIPALTIGKYSDKKQLCSFCTKLGFCQNNPPRGEPAWDI